MSAGMSRRAVLDGGPLDPPAPWQPFWPSRAAMMATPSTSARPTSTPSPMAAFAERLRVATGIGCRQSLPGPAAVEERQVAGEKPPGDRPRLDELGRRDRSARGPRRAADDRARRTRQRPGALVGGTAPG